MRRYKDIMYIVLFIIIIGAAVSIYYRLKSTKDHWEHHHGQSEIALKNDQYQKVIDFCNKAIEFEPNNPKAYVFYVNKAKALNKLNLYTEAIQSADQAIELNPRAEEAYETKVYPLFQLQRHEELATVLEEIIILDPHNPLKGFLNSLRADRGKVEY